MAVLILCAFLGSALLVLTIRRALPIALACAIGWLAYHLSYDLLTACAIALAALVLSCALLDRAALSERLSLRWPIRGAELAGGILIAEFLAVSFARTFARADAVSDLAPVLISAGILSVLAVASRYSTPI